MRLPVLALLALPRPAIAAGVWPLHTSPLRGLGVRRGSSGGRVGTYESSEGTGLAFRVLALVTVLSIFALVTLGGVVRLTGSGLGCPDWPLCHGEVVPPLDTPALIEYSHRLMASVVGMLVLATALIVWWSYRRQPWLLIPATVGLFLLVAQVLVGGFTVLRELPSGIVLAHLAIAEALMASMVVVCIVALRAPSAPDFREDNTNRGRDRFPILTLGAVLAAYALLLTGSYVMVSGSATACGQSWPLCQGQAVPEGYYPMIHMVHRVVALLVGVLIVTVLILAWRRRHERWALGWMAVVVGVTFPVQVLLGAAVVWMGFPIAPRLLHLSMATLVWVGLAALAVLAYTAPKSLYPEHQAWSSERPGYPETESDIQGGKGVSRA